MGNVKKQTFWVVLGLLLALVRPARGDEARYEIQFPDLPGLVTVKCDLHMHTVFSDGQVWPLVRVAEAWRQGLDCIAITDHIEYQPHKQDVPTKHNRPYELAREAAAAHGLLFPRAAEITRDTPPGHFNAVFTTDNGELEIKDFVDAVKQASSQGAFVFWNHQGWKGAEKGRWLDVHTTIFENKWLQGMEVCNGNEYYPDAHRWCLEKNLTMLGNSDIHDPDLRKRSLPADHRTMTLVFAKAKTLPAIKEALLEGRTAVWFKDQIIGRKEYLDPLFEASVQVVSPTWRQKTVTAQVRNNCDVDISLKRLGNVGPLRLTLPAGATSLVQITVPGAADPLQLQYTATNFLIGPDTGLPVTLTVPKP